MGKRFFYFLLTFLLSFQLVGQSLPQSTPTQEGFDARRLARVDDVIERAVELGQIPGAVLLVARHNKVVYRKAYGYKSLVPEKEKMTVNTVFDLASLTKPMATATAVMMLVDRGQLRLLDRVSDIIPGYQNWQDDSTKEVKYIRIIHLLTHTSGLPPYAPVKELEKKYGAPAPDSLLAYISHVKRHHAPGTYFKYSCLNFITLQRIVEKITGKSLKEFTQKNIFGPLGMTHTTYQPSRRMAAACAPTEVQDNGLPLMCQVHDPLARIMMGGISGNAGLFSTADDMAIFAAMMLNGGVYNGHRILSPAAVRVMTRLPKGLEKFGRGLGWDLDSPYASNQGDLFSEKTYGHTGFTGTSMIIDPQNQVVVILLTNRVHPKAAHGVDVVRLRSFVANAVAGALIK